MKKDKRLFRKDIKPKNNNELTNDKDFANFKLSQVPWAETNLRDLQHLPLFSSSYKYFRAAELFIY